MANINLTDGVGSVTTTNAEVAWADADAHHSFVVWNPLEKAIRVSVTNPIGVVLDPMLIHATTAGTVDHDTQVLRDFDFTLDPRSGTVVTLNASAVSGTATARSVTFSVESLHIPISTTGTVGGVNIALLGDVASAALN